MSSPDQQAKRVDLVLEGGGVKGIALVGAISVLEEQGYEVHRVAGSSAGAIVGSLVASGVTAAELHDVMASVDYQRFRDETALDHLGPIGEGLSVLWHKGIFKGDYVVEWLSEHLRATTFGELRDDDDDPGSATSQPGRNVRLVVLASDVSNHRLAYLPWDFTTVYPRQGAPDGGLDARPIVDAVRASMSIPFFYQPAKIDYDRTVDGDTTHEIAWMVDGGMLSNFPVQVFDRTDDKPPRWPTFGIKLSARPETAQAPHPMGGTLDFARSLIATMTGFFDRVHIEDPKVIERTIFVDTTGVSSTDFGIDRATQDRLFDNGRTAATAFLQGLKS